MMHQQLEQLFTQRILLRKDAWHLKLGVLQLVSQKKFKFI